MNLMFSSIILKFLVVVVFYIVLEEINTHLKNIEKMLKIKEAGNELTKR